MTRESSDDWEERARTVASNLSRAADELTRLIEDYRKARKEREPDDRSES